MIPEVIPSQLDHAGVCQLAQRWKISYTLAEKLYLVAMRLEFPLTIISGFRTREHQLELAREGRPAVDPDVSTHCSCPATGVDVWPSIAVTNVVKARLGAVAVAAGLRWGGGLPGGP